MNRPPRARNSLKRLLRVIFILFWLTLLLSPCLGLVLAARGELRIRTGAAPEQETRLWLVQEARRAGLALSHVSERLSDSQRCFQTDVRFLLWRGQELDGNTATSFCSCYPLADSAFNEPQFGTGSCEQGVEGSDD